MDTIMINFHGLKFNECDLPNEGEFRHAYINFNHEMVKISRDNDVITILRQGQIDLDYDDDKYIVCEWDKHGQRVWLSCSTNMAEKIIEPVPEYVVIDTITDPAEIKALKFFRKEMIDNPKMKNYSNPYYQDHDMPVRVPPIVGIHLPKGIKLGGYVVR